jgi:predicted small metal-binding protein
VSKKVLFCGDVVPGCDAKVEDADIDGIMRQAAAHAKDAHGLATIDEATAAKVRSAIRDA